MLHYNPRHVSSSTVLIFRRSNSTITTSGIVALCKRLYNKPAESSLLSTGGCVMVKALRYKPEGRGFDS